MEEAGIKPILIILVDISGYTNFIKLHKMSLLHAEKIIGELMESMLDEVELPVVAHEILGDAISLYAIDNGSPDLANNIYNQMEKYFSAFWNRESYLLRECGLCLCDACNKVGELKLKGILHFGEAAFTKVRDIQKISGEDIILTHRLLKNSISSDEYIFITDAFLSRCSDLDTSDFETHTERYADVGTVGGMVKKYGTVQLVETDVSFGKKFKMFMKLDKYMIARLFGKSKLTFRNLPQK